MGISTTTERPRTRTVCADITLDNSVVTKRLALSVGSINKTCAVSPGWYDFLSGIIVIEP